MSNSQASDWEDSDLIEQIAQDLKDAYVRPLSLATETKHLQAISRTLAQSHRSQPNHSFTPAEARSAGPNGAAINFARPLELQRTAGRPESGGLASPFARSSSATTISRAKVDAAPATGRIVDAKAAGAAKWRQQHVLLGSLVNKAAVFVAALALGASWGLAKAGALPDPVQTAFSQAGEVVGLIIPAPIPVHEIAVPVPEIAPVPATPAPAPVDAPLPSSQYPASDTDPGVPGLAPAPVTPMPANQSPSVVAEQQDWITRMIREALGSATSVPSGANSISGPDATPRPAQPTAGDPSTSFWDRYGWGAGDEGGSTATSSSGPSRDDDAVTPTQPKSSAKSSRN